MLRAVRKALLYVDVACVAPGVRRPAIREAYQAVRGVSYTRVMAFRGKARADRIAVVGLTFISAAFAGCSDADAQGDPSGWLSVETLFSDDEIVAEKVSYMVDGLRVSGLVCYPVAPGRHPIVVSNHGGFQGLSAGELSDQTSCRQSARSGYVLIESSYRGEDESEGEVEVCLGEVDDVLTMLEIARRQAYADPDRVGMIGGSHGGCITLRALQRGAPVQVGVVFAPPTDLAALYRYWVETFDQLEPTEQALFQQLMDVVRGAAGGTPEQVPEEYRLRSPLAFADELQSVDGTLVVLHGDADTLVPPRHSCDIAAAAGGFESFHLDGSALETTAAPAGCADSSLNWLAGPRPALTWPGDRYLVVYDEVPHGFLPDHPPSAAAFGDFLAPLTAKLPPEP